jgi:GNAT superfamily N-acetyltransferase
MSADITIRQAAPSDLDQLMSLLEANRPVFGILLRQHVEAEIDNTRTYKRKFWFVAEAYGTLVGAVYVYHGLRDISYPNYLCVDPAFRGAGVGRRLLEQVEHHARALNQRKVEFQCPEGNPANALYAHLGYANTGRERATRNYLLNWERVFPANT